MPCCFICDLIAALIALPAFLWRHRNDYARHKAYLRELNRRSWRLVGNHWAPAVDA